MFNPTEPSGGQSSCLAIDTVIRRSAMDKRHESPTMDVFISSVATVDVR
ncbi:hypothetical protein SAMN05421752_101395 [Natronorubrum thiooxidans]|uniref:Uncharacterized protein n=1 Tax=Natronorubrum thiooxidans TaxID=308853 RepID=A0A1N7CJ01_9EURY|nr:hypothetical protein SAMN05421752_101395 [Natronorubrum thiooxidans]